MAARIEKVEILLIPPGLASTAACKERVEAITKVESELAQPNKLCHSRYINLRSKLYVLWRLNSEFFYYVPKNERYVNRK